MLTLLLFFRHTEFYHFISNFYSLLLPKVWSEISQEPDDKQVAQRATIAHLRANKSSKYFE